MSTLILSVVGSDRPGLTQALSAAVYAAGGNWLESHLSQLGGLYVGSVLIELESDRMDALQAEVQKVDAQGLQVRVVAAASAAPKPATSFAFNLVGQDRPGIVRQVTEVLAALKVNIETFDTHVAAEPHSGSALFHLDAQLSLPGDATLDQARAALEAISAEIMVDISIVEAKAR